MELPSGLEPPNLLITNEVLYRLSYGSMPYSNIINALNGFDNRKITYSIFKAYSATKVFSAAKPCPALKHIHLQSTFYFQR